MDPGTEKNEVFEEDGRVEIEPGTPETEDVHEWASNWSIKPKPSDFIQRMADLKAECEKLENIVAADEPEYMTRFKILDQVHHLVQIFVREYLDKWKWSQIPRHGEDSAQEKTLLIQILEWFHQLMDTIKLLEYPDNSHKVQKILLQLKRVLHINSIGVDQQPPRTAMQHSTCDTTIKFLDQNMAKMISGGTAADFKIFMISETFATELYKNKMLLAFPYPPEMSCQKVLSNMNKQEAAVDTKFFKIQINMSHQISRHSYIRCQGRKVALLYLTTVDILGEETDIWCVSRPFVMTNARQRCAAEATIFWDNYFRKNDGTANTIYETKENVSFVEFGRGLTLHFKAETLTDWTLTQDNLRHIGSKIFDDASFDEKTCIVNRDQFCTLQRGRDSVWQWLYEIIVLIKKSLSAPWGAGAIIGFIDRTEAEELLRRKRRGTFLLRFSDGMLGGLSVTASMPGKGSSSLAPFNERDFSFQSLEAILTSHEKTGHNCKYLLHHDHSQGKLVVDLKEKLLNIPAAVAPTDPGPDTAPGRYFDDLLPLIWGAGNYNSPAINHDNDQILDAMIIDTFDVNPSSLMETDVSPLDSLRMPVVSDDK